MSTMPPHQPPPGRARRISRRRFFKIAAAGFTAMAVGQPVAHLARTRLLDRDDRAPLPPQVVDDASRLNQTHVAQIWPMPSNSADAEAQLAALLQHAHARQLPVAIAAARHTMGGHTIAPDGIALNMLPFNRYELARDAQQLWVQAGARWADILPVVDAHGLSIAVMQSNNSFSIGGAINANAHGWQHNHPPLASTIESCRVMLADGQIVRCSRLEQSELFGLVMGGYGLFGVILDLTLRLVPNARYRYASWIVPSQEYASAYDRYINQTPGVGMVFGRLSVAPAHFLREAILNVFSHDEGMLPALDAPRHAGLMRSVLRGSVGSPYGKALRWDAEKAAAVLNQGKIVSRNYLLNEPVTTFENRTAASTDILHEYFVPLPQLEPFLEQLRQIIPAHNGDLLNATLRTVARDADSFLRYADQDVVGVVLLFNQSRTLAADQAMEQMTQALIDAVLNLGGRYYLPYRLHARAEQLHQAYPQARQFFAHKRHYDPEERFQNRFYQTYGRT